jgi:hypothetical protein
MKWTITTVEPYDGTGRRPVRHVREATVKRLSVLDA